MCSSGRFIVSSERHAHEGKPHRAPLHRTQVGSEIAENVVTQSGDEGGRGDGAGGAKEVHRGKALVGGDDDEHVKSDDDEDVDGDVDGRGGALVKRRRRNDVEDNGVCALCPAFETIHNVLECDEEKKTRERERKGDERNARAYVM